MGDERAEMRGSKGGGRKGVIYMFSDERCSFVHVKRVKDDRDVVPFY